jgi:hypothetical protein
MKVLQKATSIAAAAALLFGLGACEEGAASTGAATANPSGQATTATTASASSAAQVMAPKGDVFFIQPTDGATVFPDFEIAFGVKDLEIAASGAADAKQGYIVVIVDGAAIPDGQAVPNDDKHLTFAKGEKDGSLKLDKGKHKLTIQFVSGAGKSWGPKLSQTIEVDVIEDEGERSVAFLAPKDGDKVKSPLKVKFDVKGMKIELAGKDPKARTTGHHHVLVGHDAMAVGVTIPDDATHKHYGKGQTEAEVELPKGKQKLTLQFADGSHVSYGPKMSATITVEVE